MPEYTFKAKKKNGEEYTETVEADDKTSLFREVQNRGHSLVSIEEKQQGNILSNIIRKAQSIQISSSVKEIDKINFARHLSSMLEAGLPLSRALSVMERQAHSQELEDILKDIQTAIKEGGTLSSGLERHSDVFSKMFIAMVRAGEEGGNLEEGLQTIGMQMEKSYALKRRIRGAMIYPCVILGVMVAIGVLMLTFIVPTLTEVFDDLGVDLPAMTQAIVWASDMLVDNALLVLSAVVAAGASLVLFLRTKAGGHMVDFIILHVPVINTIVKEVNSARTTRTLSSLLSAGVDVVPALEITENVIQNSYYKPVLREARERIQRGEQISEVFIDNQHLFPILVGEMVNVGEETGKMSEMLLGVADFFEDEVDQKTKNISTIIEPVLMVVIGIGVGFFAISMLMPMYSIMDQI